MTTDLIQELEARVEHAPSGAERITALNELASVMLRVDLARAIALYERARAQSLALPGGSPRDLADATLGLGCAHVARSQYEQALVECAHALDQYRAIGALEGQVRALQQLGTTYRVLGDYPQALEHQLQALDLARRCGDGLAECTAALHIGMIYSELGRFAEALESYDRALALCEEFGSLRLEARILNSYSVDCTNSGEYERAIACGRRSAQLFALVDEVFGQGVALASMGEAYVAAGQHGEAAVALEQALELMRSRDPDLNTVEALSTSYQLGVAYRTRGDFERARGYIAATRARAAAARISMVEYQCYEQLAAIDELLGDDRQALAHYRAFHTLREQVFNEANAQKLRNLEVLHRTRQALDEAERQRRMREDDMRSFDQLAALQQEFFSSATHDLKNPLTAIDLGTRLLEQHVAADDAEGRDVLLMVRRSVGQMYSLITDILELARLQTARTLRAGVVDVAHLLASVVRDHQIPADRRGVALQIVAAPPDLRLECDSQLVRRALDNLVGNALKYTPAGGAVTVAAAWDDETVSLRVSDSGLGIPAEDIPRLFERFFRVQRREHLEVEGTGLGLAIVKSIVDQHGGEVSVESELGRGSAFTMRLPLSAREARAGAQQAQ